MSLSVEIKRKAGDVRSDGYVFSQYSRAKNGKIYEIWLSPQSREKDLAARRARINAKRGNPTFLSRERKNKNTSRRLRYQQDSEYRESQIRLAVQSEKKRASDPNWRLHRNGQKRKRTQIRYKSDPNFRAAMIEKTARRRGVYRHAQSKHLIRVFYEMSVRLSGCTGIKHHVDHIQPISKGGKHIATNLRAIPARKNQRKYNKTDGFYD